MTLNDKNANELESYTKMKTNQLPDQRVKKLVSHALNKTSIANRALELVDSNIKNPKVLILGVAYKPGVGDVRETPASGLREFLISQGADVAWHDPLVTSWKGTSPVDLSWSCDVAILVTSQPGMDLTQLLAKDVQILDCTNSLNKGYGVSPL